VNPKTKEINDLQDVEVQVKRKYQRAAKVLLTTS
jgi:hypothetical protein